MHRALSSSIRGNRWDQSERITTESFRGKQTQVHVRRPARHNLVGHGFTRCGSHQDPPARVSGGNIRLWPIVAGDLSHHWNPVDRAWEVAGLFQCCCFRFVVVLVAAAAAGGKDQITGGSVIRKGRGGFYRCLDPIDGFFPDFFLAGAFRDLHRGIGKARAIGGRISAHVDLGISQARKEDALVKDFCGRHDQRMVLGSVHVACRPRSTGVQEGVSLDRASVFELNSHGRRQRRRRRCVFFAVHRRNDSSANQRACRGQFPHALPHRLAEHLRMDLRDRRPIAEKRGISHGVFSLRPLDALEFSSVRTAPVVVAHRNRGAL
mmetsp:Transcript_86304/g.175354  ORF Transcript_86304/g.175354 Transcript_86304/m.175354 type:complete len:321 (-) Transcript_86304:575-1537(-)